MLLLIVNGVSTFANTYTHNGLRLPFRAGREGYYGCSMTSISSALLPKRIGSLQILYLGLGGLAPQHLVAMRVPVKPLDHALHHGVIIQDMSHTGVTHSSSTR